MNEAPPKGTVRVGLSERGFHLVFTRTPAWAYIIIAIGIMFALIIGAHAFYVGDGGRKSRLEAVSAKLLSDEPLTDADVRYLENLNEKDKREFSEDFYSRLGKGPSDSRED